uniref:Uncharacterized protein n=1 Tax=Plectus sambesii TaxID=2011161 RepID=A0A914UID1_9BILA
MGLLRLRKRSIELYSLLLSIERSISDDANESPGIETHRKQHQEVSKKKAKDEEDRDRKERKKSGKQQRINFPV